MVSAGIYLHIPFCLRKCTYCDFASYPGLSHLHADYVAALDRELARRADRWAEVSFDTVYVGGGTPTVLAASQLVQLLEGLRSRLSMAPAPEITVEANPGTVNLDGLLTLRAAGVTRLSLGVQSLDDGELALLGRIHDAGGALAACELARRAGFDNLNLDLIYGLPGQPVIRWRETLERAIALAPEHLSLYGLTLEEGTPLARRVARGGLPAPDEDAAADMYELAESLLDAAGYVHYEISNWARGAPGEGPLDIPALACRHNLKYWRNQRYLGLGAAAHSYDGRKRAANVADPVQYLARALRGGDLCEQSEEMSREQEMGETMMLGLRLLAGVIWDAFSQRFGVGLREVYGREVDELTELGLLEIDAQGLRLSPRGRLLGNRVFAAFLR